MFTLTGEKELPGLRAKGKIYRHDCGLEVLSIECDDSENMFSVGFATTPVDDTGVTHIIEHSVLGGSRRFPVKDPFMEMIKGSVATFINAITYQDHTVYPIASTISKDYFNLAEVYFDAIFNPLMTRQAFAQEGWHYELAKPGNIKSALKFNGIVLNEMTGAMSDLDEIISHELYSCMLNGTPRRFVSGGAPNAIPKLTYAKYRKYYLEHYHPSLAKVFLYGNIPTDKKLDFLDKRLGELGDRGTVAAFSPRSRQSRWTKPREKVAHYAPEVKSSEKLASLAMGYFLTDDWEPLLDGAFEFLDYLLLGNISSPLRKRIMESGLCNDMAISGYDNETLETTFIIACTGVRQENIRKLRGVIEEELRRICENGFSQRELTAAFMQFKVEQREITMDYVYNQMEKVFDAWCYGKDPFMFLDNSSLLSQLEEKMRKEPGWLCGVIRKYLIENTHVLALTLLPDPQLAEFNKKALAKRLQSIKVRKSELAIRRLDAFAAKLKDAQDKPNSPEALATLPFLKREDVPDKPLLFKSSRSVLQNGVTFVDVANFTNGIAYMDLAYPLSAFTAEELLDLSNFIRLCPRLGTEQRNYAANASAWAELGASFSYNVVNGIRNTDTENFASYLEITMKAPEENVPAALDLLKEKISGSVFSEKKYIGTMLRQIWNRNKEDIAYSMYSYAMRRASAGISPLGALSEHWYGIDALRMNHANADNFNGIYASLRERMERIEAKISAMTPIAVCYEGGEAQRHHALDFAGSFAQGQNLWAPLSKSVLPAVLGGRREALLLSGTVSGCARVYAAPRFFEDDSIALRVYSNILSCGYLWDEIRIKGGAYGASASYNSMMGTLAFTSSQDPAPTTTFDIFRNTASFRPALSQKDLDNAVLSSIRECFIPHRPGKVIMQAMSDAFFQVEEQFTIDRYRKFLDLDLKTLQDGVERFWASKPMFGDAAVGAVGELQAAGMAKLEI